MLRKRVYLTRRINSQPTQSVRRSRSLPLNRPLLHTIMPRVAFQGEPGAYSQQAAIQFFGEDANTQYHPCTNFRHMYKVVSNGTVDHAAVPIENSLAGTIHENLDLLLQHVDLTIIGELDFRVRHCLVTNKGVQLKDVKTVRSHPMALAQCPTYLQDNHFIPEVAYDTAGAAKILQKTKSTDSAAICSKKAAEIYDLDVLAEGIEDEKSNFTRFLIVSKHKVDYTPDVPSKTSIAFSLINGPGKLCKALSVFAVTDIDLTKIESRHIHTVNSALKNNADDDDAKYETEKRRWGYVFFVDLSGHVAQSAVKKALDHMTEITTFFRVLGSYPSHRLETQG